MSHIIWVWAGPATCFYLKKYANGVIITMIMLHYQQTGARDSPADFKELRCHVVRGPHGRELWVPLRSESDPGWKPARTWGPSVLQPQESNSAHHHVSLEKDPELQKGSWLPTPIFEKKKMKRWQQLFISFQDPEQRTQLSHAWLLTRGNWVKLELCFWFVVMCHAARGN